MAMLPDGKLLINGELRDAAGGKTYDDIGPWTGEVVGKAAEGEGVIGALAGLLQPAGFGGDWIQAEFDGRADGFRAQPGVAEF